MAFRYPNLPLLNFGPQGLTPRRAGYGAAMNSMMATLFADGIYIGGGVILLIVIILLVLLFLRR